MPGKVYCFNCFNEPAELSVNGLPVGQIPGYSQQDSTKYTPVAKPVDRARHGDHQTKPVFANDRPTPISVDWDTFSFATSISLVNLPNVSLDDDLVLYIACNQLNLMTIRGFVLVTEVVNPAGLNEQGKKILSAMGHPSSHRS